MLDKLKSEFLINNLEKIIFLFIIFLVAVLLIGYQSGLYLKTIDIKKELYGNMFAKPPSSVEGLDVYNEALQKLQIDDTFSDYDRYFERRSFERYIPPTPPLPLFEFKSAEILYLDIMYKGFIESTAGMVGQIKIGERTYFVKEKEKIAEYKIIKLRRNYMQIEDAQGKQIKLPLREKIMSNEYEAILYLPRKEKTIKIKVGDSIKSFEVLDISRTYVVLLNKNTGEKLTVEEIKE